MKPTLFILALAAFSSPAQAATQIPADNLKAECRGYHGNFLFVYAGEATIYNSSAYGNSISCGEDVDRLRQLFNTARVSGDKISIDHNDRPRKDFSIVPAKGKRAAVSSVKLEASCGGYYGNHLHVYANSVRIYSPTSYGNRFSCEKDADRLQTMFNTAKAVGKKVEVGHTNSPSRDFAISDESDPLGKQSRLPSQDEPAAAEDTTLSAV